MSTFSPTLDYLTVVVDQAPYRPNAKAYGGGFDANDRVLGTLKVGGGIRYGFSLVLDTFLVVTDEPVDVSFGALSARDDEVHAAFLDS
jgi:hypothetical protein